MLQSYPNIEFVNQMVGQMGEGSSLLRLTLVINLGRRPQFDICLDFFFSGHVDMLMLSYTKRTFDSRTGELMV